VIAKGFGMKLQSLLRAFSLTCVLLFFAPHASAEPDLDIDAKPEAYAEIRYDAINLVLTFNSNISIADVLAMRMSQEDYDDVADFAEKKGFDLEDIPMLAAPFHDGKIQIGSNIIELKANHTIKVGANILKFDPSKTGAENWTAIYKAISELPQKAADTTSPSDGRIFSWVKSVIAGLLGQPAYAAYCNPIYYCDPDADAWRFWPEVWNAVGDVAQNVAAVGKHLYNIGQTIGLGAERIVGMAAAGTTEGYYWMANQQKKSEAGYYNWLNNMGVVCNGSDFAFMHNQNKDGTGNEITGKVPSWVLQKMVGTDVTVAKKCTVDNANDITRQLSDSQKGKLAERTELNETVAAKKKHRKDKKSAKKKPKAKDSTTVQ
jgi:hypothetical protein